MTTTVPEETQDTNAKSVMIVTESAAAKIAELIAQENEENMFLRIAVRPGGCSGLSYEMFFDAEVADDDHFDEKDGIKVGIDKASEPYLSGSTLDYKDGLQGAGFAINNPNVSKSCGCGNSFS